MMLSSLSNPACVCAFGCAYAVCGGVLAQPAGGNLSSPGYLMSNYSDNLNCEWSIQNHQHTNSSIVVLIEDLHLQSHPTCESDFLEFRLGESCTDTDTRSPETWTCY